MNSPASKRNRKEEIIAATEKLIRSRGLSLVTTRQIAEEVGCSEGALYVHFKNRLELLLAVCEESLQEARGPVKGLETAVGLRTPRRNLEDAVSGIFRFQRRAIPIFAGLFSEPELLEAYRQSMLTDGRGPHLAIARMAAYIKAEQELGRIAKDIDADMAATSLISSAFFRAFTERFFGQSQSPSWARFVKRLVGSAIGK